MIRNSVHKHLAQFRSKYHQFQLLRRFLISLSVFISIWLTFSLLEGDLWLSQSVRTVLFIGLTLLFVALIYWSIFLPVQAIVSSRHGLSKTQAAQLIGVHFPEVKDQLQNLLQLEELEYEENSLVEAAILQKSHKLSVIPFPKAISFSPNWRYVLVFGVVSLVFGFCVYLIPDVVFSGSSRLLKFQEPFQKPWPFQFQLNGDLSGYRNEPYVLDIELVGNELPQEVYMITGNRKLKLGQTGARNFRWQTTNLQKRELFYLEASGYRSDEYQIEVINRPELVDMTIKLKFPQHTGLKNKELKNIGSILIPEGTVIEWSIEALNADSVNLILAGNIVPLRKSETSVFTVERKILDDQQYQIQLKNTNSFNKTPISYEIKVIKDLPPTISASYLLDSVSFDQLFIGGEIQDDYGFNQLLVITSSSNGQVTKTPLSINPNLTNQRFFYKLDLKANSSESLKIYLTVSDNDKVNGYKSANSSSYFYQRPDPDFIKSQIASKRKETESSIKDASRENKEINEKIDDLEERLQGDRKMDWQEEQLAKELINEREDLSELIQKIQSEHDQLNKSQVNQSEQLKQKSEQLQELLAEMMDPETKALYDELQKLLEEQSSSEEVLDKLSQIKRKEINLEKELDRALALFKRLKLESQMADAAKDIEDLADKQESLAEQQSNEETQEKQSEIQSEFNEIKDRLSDMEKLNDELRNPEDLSETMDDANEISEELEEIQEDFENSKPGEPSKASPKQRNNAAKMKQMANKMKEMQSSGEMTMMQENLDHLRDILDNLVRLSFDQERIFSSFQSVQQTDPRFIELSQDQLQLIDNARVIEDSLTALAKRVVQISNFVNREVSEINYQLEEAIYDLRNRDKNKATSHQQFAMTSMNNLALLLSDVLEQMQMAMGEAMGKPQKQNSSKPNMPSMSELQKQLSQQIQDLKKSGSSGRQLSEELAKLAAEQAELREQMQELLDQQKSQMGNEEGENGQNSLGKAIELMDKNEIDLVNKNITQQLISRQEEIKTRLLEAENAMRQQEESPEREGETAQAQSNKLPKSFDEYLKTRRKEIELLRTIPLDLNSFYKKEVTTYFEQLSGQD